jgi:hypothetical protein
VRVSADLERDAFLLMAVMDGLSIQWLFDPDFDMTAAFNRFCDLLKSDLSSADRSVSTADTA